MPLLVSVGGSSGIGRDIQQFIDADVLVLPREHDALPDCKAVLFCQRYRGSGWEWGEEWSATMTRTKTLIESSESETKSIVIMASVSAVSVEEEQPVSYHACKAALVEMVKYYAVTLGPRGCRVNAIIPGLTIKPEARAFYDSHPELEATYKDITPLGRMGTVQFHLP